MGTQQNEGRPSSNEELERRSIPRIIWNIITLPYVMLKKGWWVIALAYPLLITQAGKFLGENNDPGFLTQIQWVFVLCAVGMIIGYAAMEYEPHFEFLLALVGFGSLVVFVIFYFWSIFYFAQVMKVLFPQHSSLLTVAQFALAFLIIADAGWSNPHSGVESNSRRPQNQNYSKTVAWYVYYK